MNSGVLKQKTKFTRKLGMRFFSLFFHGIKHSVTPNICDFENKNYTLCIEIYVPSRISVSIVSIKALSKGLGDTSH